MARLVDRFDDWRASESSGGNVLRLALESVEQFLRFGYVIAHKNVFLGNW